MKRTILLMTAATIIFYSCKNSGGTEVKKPKSDTTSTLGVFLGYGLKSIHWGTATRLSKDSLMWVDSDSTTKKKEWSKYVIYVAEVPITLDSTLAARLRKPLLDSLGKPTVIREPIWIEPKYFRDGVTNLDSAVADLKKYLIIDSTKSK